MKTFFSIMLIGFLGCSGSNDGTSVSVGEAIPVAPFGIMDTMTPTYEWTPVSGATRYQLMVEENDVPVIEEWYTAAEVGCASEDSLCSVTPDVDVPGDTWKVLSCAGETCGLWSDELQFSFTVAGSTPPRFTDNGDGTVTDNNTKLIWTKDANICGNMRWGGSQTCCRRLYLRDRRDWRLPTLPELKSLRDIHQRNPALPPGHPFTNVQYQISLDTAYSYYWSSTDYPYHPGYPNDPEPVWNMNFTDGTAFYAYKSQAHYTWPVRSGN
jgi:hypothetical protein